jgi:hypothetical protein
VALVSVDAAVARPVDARGATVDAPAAPGGDAREAGNPAPDAAAGCQAVQAPDYCQRVPSLARPPLIDGVLECGLALRPIAPVAWSSATAPIPPSTRASFAVAWRPDGVYVFISVDDADRVPAPPGQHPYCGDGAEIYVDDDGAYATPGRYDDPGTRQFILGAPGDDTTPIARSYVERQSMGLGAWPSSQYRLFPRPGGFDAEAFVVAADLARTSWTLAAGGRIGLDVGINVSFPPGVTSSDTMCSNRLGQFFLSAAMPFSNNCPASGLPYCSTRGFCNPTLEP